MKRPFAYITAPWTGTQYQDNEYALHYCRQVYDAGYTPICPLLFLSPILNDKIPQEHKDGLDMGWDFLRRSHVLVVCGDTVTEAMKNDIATAERLHITAASSQSPLNSVSALRGTAKTAFAPLLLLSPQSQRAALRGPRRDGILTVKGQGRSCGKK